MRKVAIVTGAGSGIGLSATRRLLQQNWSVIAIDIADEELLKIEASVGADRLIVFKTDISDSDQIQGVFRQIRSRFEKLHALIACAGVLRLGALETMGVDEYNLIFNVNTRGSWLCAREALSLLKKGATEEDPARVVFVSSVAALRPKVGNGIYAASKAAIGHLTRIFAVECGHSKVLFNAVAPGTVDTPMIRQASDQKKTGMFRPNGPSPLGRIAMPEDVVDVIEFLLGRNSRYVTGTTIAVDGGTSAAFVPATVDPASSGLVQL